MSRFEQRTQARAPARAPVAGVRVVRRAHRHPQGPAQRPLRGGPRPRQLVLHAGERDPGADHPAAGDRYLPALPVRALGAGGMGEPAVPEGDRFVRGVDTRHPPLGRLHPHVCHRDAPRAHVLLSLVQAPARAELDDRRAAPGAGAGDGNHRRLPPLGPGGLLDRGRGHQHPRLHPGHRPFHKDAMARRRGRWSHHPDAHVWNPRLAAAFDPVPDDRRPPRAAAQARRIRFVRQLPGSLPHP